jgi:mono/diheme cytochrome c family protein
MLAAALAWTSAPAQEPWTVPDDQHSEAAPFAFTPETVAKGAGIFAKNCQSCHGIPTKGNWANIKPVPGDPASEKFRKNTDGDMFYKISSGRGPMPQFRNILSEEDRWDVISYIRSFHPGYVQPDPEKARAAAKGGRSKIAMGYDSLKRVLHFDVTNTRENLASPAGNAQLFVFVKRYFGNLPIGEARTNALGLSLIHI